MRLRVAPSVVAAGIQGDLASRNEACRLMHVALTHPTGEAAAGAVPWVDIEAPIDSWAEFAVWCGQQARRTPGEGGGGQRLAQAQAKASRRILGELNRLANHPAYRELAVLGVDTTVLPAYRYGTGRWWPTMRQALQHAHDYQDLQQTQLVPEYVDRDSRTFTRWFSRTE